MKNKLRFLAVSLLVGLAALPACAGELYTVFWDNRFGMLNDANGAFSEVGTLPIAKAGGIAYDNGTLYAQDLQSNLIEINPISGASSVLESAGMNLNSVGFAGANNGLFEVDYLSNLYSINPSTGKATLVGATGLPANNGGWDTSISDDGTFLYFTEGGAGADDYLYRINPTTGVATALGDTGVTGIAGSAIVNGDLELFQYHWSGATDYIYSAPLGSTNFIATTVLNAQVVDGATVLGTPQSFLSETSSTPEPLSLLLLGSGLIALALWRRGRTAQPTNPGISPRVSGRRRGSDSSVSC